MWFSFFSSLKPILINFAHEVRRGLVGIYGGCPRYSCQQVTSHSFNPGVKCKGSICVAWADFLILGDIYKRLTVSHTYNNKCQVPERFEHKNGNKLMTKTNICPLISYHPNSLLIQTFIISIHEEHFHFHFCSGYTHILLAWPWKVSSNKNNNCFPACCPCNNFCTIHISRSNHLCA